MDEDLATYTEALNMVKIKSAFGNIKTEYSNISISNAVNKVKNSRDNIKNFIIELENSKNKCLDLLGESLYNRKREEYNKYIRNLLK